MFLLRVYFLSSTRFHWQECFRYRRAAIFTWDNKSRRPRREGDHHVGYQERYQAGMKRPDRFMAAPHGNEEDNPANDNSLRCGRRDSWNHRCVLTAFARMRYRPSKSQEFVANYPKIRSRSTSGDNFAETSLHRASKLSLVFTILLQPLRKLIESLLSTLVIWFPLLGTWYHPRDFTMSSCTRWKKYFKSDIRRILYRHDSHAPNIFEKEHEIFTCLFRQISNSARLTNTRVRWTVRRCISPSVGQYIVRNRVD